MTGLAVTVRLCSIPGCGTPHVARGWCNRHWKQWRKWGDPLTMGRTGRPPTPAADRFWAKVLKTESCWLWTAAKDRDGYGLWKETDSSSCCRSHRYAYELEVGPIPDGLQIDHLCRVRNCVNPAHLEPVTPQENTRRGFAPTGLNARKTHCKNGHEFTPENTKKVRMGRACRRCARVDDQRYRDRKSA